MMRIFRLGCLSVLALFAFATCSQGPAGDADKASAQRKEEPPPPPKGDPVVTIQTDKGDIVVRLLPKVAPRTAERFRMMAELGFYARTTFHFVSSGFIQGGDPSSKNNDPYDDGKGNAGEWITAEFNEEHEVDRGTVGMMRKDDQPDSSSCQFFIVLKRKKEWDGKYNIFGQVIEGMEVADAISEVPTIKKDSKLANRPSAKQTIKGMRLEYREFPAEAEESKPS
jgi:cyclophilin family peptidyl-prolyl cis-trans isomerase